MFYIIREKLILLYSRYHKTPVFIVSAAIMSCLIVTSAWQLTYAFIRQQAQNHTAATTTSQTASDGTSSDNNSHSTSFNNNLAKGNDSAGLPSQSQPTTTQNESTVKNTPASSAGSSSSTKSTSNTSSGATKASGGSVTNVISLRQIVPQSGRVLTLTGLNYNITNYMPAVFGGIFSRSPYTLSKVDYPASVASDSISKGVDALNTAVRSTPGQKIVLAHSQGAQVASHWMRQYANDPTAPSASELTFVLLGNPLRATGGHAIGNTEIGGTIGLPTPTTTKWPIVDVARRYEGWSDWVQNTSNQWAVDNAEAGKKAFHTHYDVVNLYDPSSTVWKVGNTTFVLTKEDILPLWDDNSQYPLSVITAMRAYIESAYNRPSNDPRTVLLPLSLSDRDTLNGWGVPF